MSELLREQIATVLLDEGGGPGNSLHSWRCEYPEVYGPCDCLREVADAVIAALPLIEERPSDLNTLAAEMQRNMPDDRRRYVTLWERIEEDE